MANYRAYSIIISVKKPWKILTRPISKTPKASGSRLPQPSSANPQASPPSTAFAASPHPPRNHSWSSTARTTTTKQQPTSRRSMGRNCISARNAPSRWPATATASPRCNQGPTSSPPPPKAPAPQAPASAPRTPCPATPAKPRSPSSCNN